MGWIRTLKGLFSTAHATLMRVPTLFKKKVIRSKHLRTVLAAQLGRILTSLLELHVLALTSFFLKRVTHSFHTGHVWSDCCVEWAIDITVPVLFSLQIHEPFRALICWTFERPLRSLARRIQYMRPNDPYQYYRVKYLILLPSCVYVWCILWVVPVSRELLHLCILQAIIIQGLTDLWPLRKDLWICATQSRARPPTQIQLLVPPTSHHAPDPGIVPTSSVHFQGSSDPFARVVVHSPQKRRGEHDI